MSNDHTITQTAPKKTDLTDTDPQVRPQDDFYAFVNNKWLKANPIPPSESRWGTFFALNHQSLGLMRDLYEDLTRQNDLQPNSIEQKTRDFYHAGMHADEYEQRHLALVDDYFARIDAAGTPSALAALLGELHMLDLGAPWEVVFDADDKDYTQHILRFRQSGLTLPDRDYYLEQSDKMKTVRTEYEAHVKKIHNYAPNLAPSADELWRVVSDFEMALANISRSRVALRDIEATYNKTTYQELAKTYANIDWPAYAKALCWQPSDQICIDQPEFMKFINQQLTARPLNEWHIYLKWHFLLVFGAKISERFALVRFEFFGKVLSGAKEIMPKWKRVVDAINHSMGEGVGKLYVARYFPESSKQQVLGMVEQLRSAFAERIKKLDWMQEPTKAYALEKLAYMKVLVGYPDTWRDFSGLQITRDSYLDNVIAALKFDFAYYMNRLHEPTSRDEWQMNPQTANAYHDPNRAVICFPAAILQPPFFSPSAPLAANLGGIGGVIGHELTHGFDDQGCQFDAQGNVRMWQSPQDRAAFDKKAQTIVDQANQFEVLPGVNLQGKLVLGEALADLGGLEIAHQALRQNPTAAGAGQWSAEQLFFISNATCEREARRDETIRMFAAVDPHPAPQFRVNATIQNTDGFYQAFDVREGDKLYRPPQKRAKIW